MGGVSLVYQSETLIRITSLTHLKIMKNVLNPKLVLAIVVAGILSLTLTANDTEACSPGQVYAEGNRFLGVCWGSSGSECAKCIKAPHL